MKTIIDITLVALVTIYIVDLSGIKDTLLDFRSKYTGRTYREWKPFTCSLCMTWWVCLLYVICIGKFQITTIAYVALLSMLSAPISQFLVLIRETLTTIISNLLKKL